MRAEVPWRIKVLATHEDIVEVSAVTLEDAKEEAMTIPGVIAVIED